ncbi:hypothetical protein [Streptomyces sp. NPDC046909]|uniref:hypothetical protein n=1 Tax=Streptomyces sp. NPDC046909 TaxID=3155617 RepID=UPI0033F59D83
MNCPRRLLYALYVTTSAGLAWTTALEFRHGPAWAGFLFAAASLVPLIAVIRESEMPHEPFIAYGVAAGAHEDVVRAELDGACCERWWTSCGTDHDTTCPHRIPRSSAA